MKAKFLILAVLLVTPQCSPKAAPQPEKPKPLTKVVFAADVPDAAVICVQLNPEQVTLNPTIWNPVCGETVGDLRRRMLQERAAN